MGFSFVEAFILPRIATATPTFVQSWMGMLTGPEGSYDLGALPTIWTLTGAIYILGGLLFGIATFRAAILPRWAGALLCRRNGIGPPIASQLPRRVAAESGPTGWDCSGLVYATRSGLETANPTPRDPAVDNRTEVALSARRTGAQREERMTNAEVSAAG